MLEENYRYIAVVFMVTTLYNIQQASGGPNRVCTPGTFRRGPHPLGICGSFIDDILDTLCFNGFNGRRKKRGITSEGHKELAGVSLSQEDANTYLVNKKTSFAHSGIVCECCYHYCTIDELNSYCI